MAKLPVVLTVAGVCLEVAAILVINWEQRQTDRENEQLAAIRRHIDTLSLGAEELKAKPFPKGSMSAEGVDLAQVSEILQAATGDANLLNRKLLLDQIDKYERAQSLRRPYKTLAQAFIGVGAVVTILGATLQ